MKNETPLVTVPSRFSLRFVPVLVIAALMALCPTLTRADTIALSVTGDQLAFAQEGATAGYAFTLSSSVLVTQLGLWDQGNNGLVDSHLVTIWTSTGVQQAQVTIPAGTGTTLTDGFRYVSIPSVLLAAGSYTIAGFYPTDPDDTRDELIIDASTITPAPGITYNGSRLLFGSGFPTGDDFGQPNSYFGPNFQFTPTGAVPDAGSTLPLLGLASLGLVALRRKLRC